MVYESSVVNYDNARKNMEKKEAIEKVAKNMGVTVRTSKEYLKEFL
jgi:hypothetical protein